MADASERVEAPPAGQPIANRQQWLAEHAEQTRDAKPRLRRPLGTSPIIRTHTGDWEQRHWTSRSVHVIGRISAMSGTGITALVLVVAWFFVGVAMGFPEWWQTVLFAVTGSVTFVMVFVIQHTNERQTSATQRKLDELIRSSSRADDSLIAVEEADDDHLQALATLNLADRERAGR